MHTGRFARPYRPETDRSRAHITPTGDRLHSECHDLIQAWHISCAVGRGRDVTPISALLKGKLVMRIRTTSLIHPTQIQAYAIGFFRFFKPPQVTEFNRRRTE